MFKRFRQTSIRSLLVFTGVAAGLVWWNWHSVGEPQNPSEFHFIDSASMIVEKEDSGRLYCFDEPSNDQNGSVMRMMLLADSGVFSPMTGLMAQLPSEVTIGDEFLLKPVSTDMVPALGQGRLKMPTGYFGGFMTAHQTPVITVDGATQTSSLKINIISKSKEIVRAKFLFVLELSGRTVRIEQTENFKRRRTMGSKT